MDRPKGREITKCSCLVGFYKMRFKFSILKTMWTVFENVTQMPESQNGKDVAADKLSCWEQRLGHGSGMKKEN